MRRVAVLAIFLMGLAVAATATAGDGAALLTATGVIEKAGKDTLIIQPREAGGKFGKKLTLKVTGTSKISSVAFEKRAGKLVPVQRDVDARELEAKHSIAVIYTSEGARNILLSAVVHREAGGK